MINTSEEMRGVPQKGYKYLVQKNARCMICGGSLKTTHRGKDIYICCNDCKTRFKLVGFGEGVHSNEIEVEVI